MVKKPPAMRETWVQSLGWEDPLEKGMATHSSDLAWRIPWTVWSMGLQRVGLSLSLFSVECLPQPVVFDPLFVSSPLAPNCLRMGIMPA